MSETHKTHEWSSEGTKLEHLFNGVVVAYSIPSGETITVGPPGAKTDRHDSDLADPHDALTAHGITRWGWLQVDSVATHSTAVMIGKAWLSEQRQSSKATYTCAHCGAVSTTPPWET